MRNHGFDSTDAASQCCLTMDLQSSIHSFTISASGNPAALGSGCGHLVDLSIILTVTMSIGLGAYCYAANSFSTGATQT